MQAARDGLPGCIVPRRHSGGACGGESLVRIALEAPSEDGSGVLASTPSGSLYVDASSPSATARQHCARPSLPQALLCRLAPRLTLHPLHLFPVMPRCSASALLRQQARSAVSRLQVKVPFWSMEVKASQVDRNLVAVLRSCLAGFVAAAFARRRPDPGADDRNGSSSGAENGAQGFASGVLARMAVARLGNGLGRSWSAVEKPSPLSESSGAFLGTAPMLQGG